MSNANEVAILEFELKQAREAQKATQRAQNVERLKSVRANLAEMRAHFDTLATEIRTIEARRGELNGKVESAQLRLSAPAERRPSVADIPELCDDPGVVEWRSAFDKAKAEVDSLIAERNACHVGDRRVRTAELARDIDGLLFAERNLMNALNGTLARPEELGGVFSV